MSSEKCLRLEYEDSTEEREKCEMVSIIKVEEYKISPQSTSHIQKARKKSCIQSRTQRKKSARQRLSNYNKKKILEHLKQHGCTPKAFRNSLKTFRVPEECAKDFIQKQIDGAQANVYQECNSFSFRNINKWLEKLKEMNLDKKCLYEPAIVVKAIANDEPQPDPEDLCGIDLKALYNFLANALMGLPTNNLNAESSRYLIHIFNKLIDSVNTAEGDVETSYMKLLLDSGGSTTNKKHQYSDTMLSLDPLGLEHDIVDHAMHESKEEK